MIRGTVRRRVRGRDGVSGCRVVSVPGVPAVRGWREGWMVLACSLAVGCGGGSKGEDVEHDGSVVRATPGVAAGPSQACPPIAEVTVHWPGAVPSEVEARIAEPVAAALAELDGVASVWSKSDTQGARLRVEGDAGRDAVALARLVEDAVRGATTFPEDATPPNVTTDDCEVGSEAVWVLDARPKREDGDGDEDTATGEQGDSDTPPGLQRVAPLEAVSVVYDPAKLSALGVPVGELERAVSGAVAAGLSGRDPLASLASIPISTGEGKLVRLSELVSIETALQPLPKATLAGESVTLLRIAIDEPDAKNLPEGLARFGSSLPEAGRAMVGVTFALSSERDAMGVLAVARDLSATAEAASWEALAVAGHPLPHRVQVWRAIDARKDKGAAERAAAAIMEQGQALPGCVAVGVDGVSGVTLEVLHPDTRVRQRAVAAMLEEVGRSNAADEVGSVWAIVEDLDEASPQVRALLTEAASARGVRQEDVDAALRRQASGGVVGQLEQAGRRMEVSLRAAGASTKRALSEVTVYVEGEGDVPLSSLATLQQGQAATALVRRDGVPSSTVRVFSDSRTVSPATLAALVTAGEGAAEGVKVIKTAR